MLLCAIHTRKPDGFVLSEMGMGRIMLVSQL
jgi:hypothetical protein